MKWFKGLLYILTGLYLFACIGLYGIQEQIIFNPTRLPAHHTFSVGEEINIEVEPGVSLNTLWFREANSKGLVLYWHGNRGNLQHCTYQAKTLAGQGMDVLMPDYRGYGKSDGEIGSEKQLLSDAQKVYDWAKKHYEESQIVMVGYSLGTGVAAHLAAHNQPAHLTLVAPYYSFIDLKNKRFPLVPNLLLKYPLRNDHFLSKVTCPVTLFHGTKDAVIPYDSSVRLQQIRPNLIQLVSLPQESHRGAIFHPRLRSSIGNWHQ